MLIYKWAGDGEDDPAAQRPPRWFPAAWLALSLPEGSELLLVADVMSGGGGSWDGHQSPRWVFQRLHVLNVVKEDGG